MLRALSGKQHSVITGFTLLDTASQHVLSEAMEAKVWFKNLSDEVIDAYLATGEPFDKAGAYALQGKGRDLVEKIEGKDSVVIGLPIERVTILLDQFGIKKEK